MNKLKAMGMALILIGVLFNNYVYLHDLVVKKHHMELADRPGFKPGYYISLGNSSIMGIVGSLVVIGAGVLLVIRPAPPRSPS